MRRTVFRVALLMLSATLAKGQEAPQAVATPATETPLAYPPATLLPVRLIGIDRFHAAPARGALAALEQDLANRFLANVRSLTEFVGAQKPLTLNLRRATDRIRTGEFRGGAPDEPLLVEPVWCQVMDHDVLFLQISDARRHTLLASGHWAIPRERWLDAARTGELAGLLTGAAATLETRARQALAARPATPPADALRVGLNLGRHVTRQDEGSSHCLNLLVQEAWAPEMTIVRTVGSEAQGALRRALGQASELRRPTRVINVKWHHQETGDVPRALPVTLTIRTSFAESVLGQPVPPDLEGPVTFAANGDRITFQGDPGMREWLEGERNALKRDDWPQVAKIDRAWAYLDRGRAWGLRMRDRMIAQAEDGEIVTGHVVRFFGPAEGVVSPRGFPVNEGAILYIRKNQKKTKVGMEFRFDPKAYPTPWPPVSK